MCAACLISLTVYNRLHALIRDPTRRLCVFPNEHFRDTFVERRKGETPNDRNDRAIRVATAWFAKHMTTMGARLKAANAAAAKRARKRSRSTRDDSEDSASDAEGGDGAYPSQVLLLTNDAANRRLALEADIPAQTVHAYVKNVSKSQACATVPFPDRLAHACVARL